VGRTGLIAGGSILVGLLVFVLKGAAWRMTGSAAFFSDALETLVNVAASGLALWAIRFAAKPADADHTYGHAKAELFAAIVEGALITLAAVAILQHAWDAWRQPEPLTDPLRGLWVNLSATVLNAVWAWVLIRNGKKYRSPALSADGRHLVADVVTSVGIAVGIVLVVVTGRIWLDPLLAAAVAVYVLWEGMRMIGASANVLMDAAPSPEVVERIRRLVAEHAAGALEAHDLRTRHAGPSSFLEFHLVVPGNMTVAEAHDICDRIEAALHAEMHGLLVTIHVEPDHKAKHHGVLVL
jgi:cation diffusion facilitator family transporter